jgi:hypothetical protein
MLVKYYKDCAPSIRTCLNLADGDGIISVGDMVTNATRAARRLLRLEGGVLIKEEYDANVLFSIHPANKARSRMRLAIATDRIHDIILAQASRLDSTEQSRFYWGIHL